MKSDQFILMADVIGSGEQAPEELMNAFKEMVNATNEKYHAQILSPLTITLGDEFQGVVTNLSSGLNLIMTIEEFLIQKKRNFKLRYVLYEGKIETSINYSNSYGMLGSGLTQARKKLDEEKQSNNRFNINLNNSPHSIALNNIFFVYQDLVDAWKFQKDYEIVSAFLDLGDYKKVAEKLGKNGSLMWKRKKSLKIDLYNSVKEIINYLSNE